MRKNVLKRIIATIILHALMMTSVYAEPSYGVGTVLEAVHFPGEAYHNVNKDDCIDRDNAEITEKGVNIKAGGSATFGFSTRYAIRGVKLIYEGDPGTVTIDTGENVYTDVLTDSGEHTIYFGENLGKEKQLYDYNNQHVTGFYREYAERRGEHEVVVSAENGILLKELVFEKELVPYLSKFNQMTLTDTEKVFMTTVVLDEDSPVFVINGAKRYINYNDTSAKPYNYNGRLYLPINTVAKAFGYYHEDLPDRRYVLMRNKAHEVVLLNGTCTVSHGLAERKELNEDVIIYRNGETLAALRYFAELAGETVVYDDGLIIIDDKYAVKDIMNNVSLYMYAEDMISKFRGETGETKTYYVAQKSEVASDTNEGTAFAPFKTLKKAAEVAEAGDTVIVREGIYRETLKPKNDGLPNAPITFKAEGDNVVISANDLLGNWVPYENGIYTTTMDWDLGVTRNQIFIDNQMLTEARYPNEPYKMSGGSPDLSSAWPVKGDLRRVRGANLNEQIENMYKVRSSSLLWQDEPDYWKGGVWVGIFGSGYAVTSGAIEGSKAGELTISKEVEGYWDTYTRNFAENFNWGSIVGHIHALDIPGEWVTQDGTLYMMFPENSTPNVTPVEAKRRNLVVDLNDRKFINVVGFDTIGGTVRMNDSEMCMVNGFDMKYAGHYIHGSDQAGGYIDFDYEGYELEGDAQNTNEYGHIVFNQKKPGAPEEGIVGNYIAGTDNIFVNNNIDHSAGAGIYLQGLYTYAENNTINDAGYAGSYVAGIISVAKRYLDRKIKKGGHSIYNNTVYNCGRSLINIKSLEGYTPFLPVDVAYNDFHDGILSSSDTGLAYTYDSLYATENMFSNMRNNYMYLTTEPINNNPHSYMMYSDGLAFGMDVSKNVLFCTKFGSKVSNKMVRRQIVASAAPHFLTWDNTEIPYVPGGVENLDEMYFAEDRPFYAGSFENKQNYTKNYDRFINGKYAMENLASNAIIGDGVELDEASGYAAFSDDGQEVIFENVDFEDGSDRINLAVRGNLFRTYDDLEVIVDDKVYDALVEISAPDGDDPALLTVKTDLTTGKHDVKVRTKKFYSAEIGGLTTWKNPVSETEADANDVYAMHRYGGEPFEIGQFAENEHTKEGPTPVGNLDTELTSTYMKNTWPGYYAVFKQAEFTSDSDKFVICAGSQNDYKNQPVEVYIDGLEPENMVAKFNVVNTTWFHFDPLVVDFIDGKVVKAGKHDVYLYFPTEEGMKKSSNISEIGFVKQGASLDYFTIKVRGGNFDDELSTQNEEFPFEKAKMNPPDFTNYGVDYTLPGTVAGYKNIRMVEESDKVIMSYATTNNIDEQPIEIRVVNTGTPKETALATEPLATYITTGDNINEFKEVTIPLNKTLPSGEYDIYLSFGGGEGERLSTKIHWFRLAK